MSTPETPDIYIGVKSFPNPRNIKVSADTDLPAVKPMPGGAKMDTSLGHDMPADVSNPARAAFLPSLRSRTTGRQIPVRHNYGSGVPEKTQ
jgi:hypothetical protein